LLSYIKGRTYSIYLDNLPLLLNKTGQRGMNFWYKKGGGGDTNYMGTYSKFRGFESRELRIHGPKARK
jgi:hypothetical protein